MDTQVEDILDRILVACPQRIFVKNGKTNQEEVEF